MSLLNDASLVMIPSGYKDTKLYSVKPTNGDGDFTFSRGSNLAATRVNSDGLIEKGRENLLLQSNQFDTTWVTANSSVTSGQSGYDGSSDAWLLDKSGASGRITQTKSVTGIFTFSVYVKKGTTDWILLYKTGTGEGGRFFDLTNGVIGSSISTAPIDSKIESVGNDWYRCSIVGNSANAVVMYVADSDGSLTDTSGNIYIQDSQLESGLISTPYIETGASTAQAGILEDMPRLDYSGGASCPSLLLEPQRTNLLTHSEYFDDSSWSLYFFGGGSLTKTFGYTSPEGVDNAYKLDVVVGTGGVLFTHNFTATASVDHTLSVWMKGEVGGEKVQIDLKNSASNGITGSLLTLTNEWKRYDLTLTNDTGTSRGFQFRMQQSSGLSDQTIYVYGAMAESSASHPSSYIPTYGASVTRGNEELDLSNWVSQGIISDSNEWTIFYEVDGLTTDYNTGDSQWLRGQDGTIDVYMRAGATAENFARFYWRKDSKYIGSTFGKKIIARLGGGTGTTFADGVEIASSSISGDYSNIGLDMGNSNSAGFVKQFLIFPTALSDDECIQLTTL